MSLEIVNRAARRDVKKTSRFANLMKAGNCSTVRKSTGDTKHSVDAIKEIAYKYAFQTKDVAKELLGKTFAETVNNDYNFLYTHFQYKADPELQHMRSPNCSWAERFTGIDCKSFSILASTLLLNQGIVHYIRRIKQPNYQQNHWTHVYVIIPKNQSDFNLNEGYYIIDATLHQNIESNFLEKHDTLMSNLPHVWLNGPSTSLDAQSEFARAAEDFSQFLEKLAKIGVSGLTISQLHNVINNSMQKGRIPYLQLQENAIVIDGKTYNIIGSTYGLAISFNDFSNIFGSGWSPSCIGGTYNSDDLEYSKPRIIQGFIDLYDGFNNALNTQNPNNIKVAVNAILQASGAFKNHTERTASHDWSSRCSRDVTNAFKQMGVYYNDIATKAFYGYLNTYFDIYTQFITVPNNSYPFETRGSDGLKKNEFVSNVQVIQVLTLQLKNMDIPYFEVTPYVAENIQSQGFNLENFLNTLGNVAIQLQSGSNNGSTNGNTTGGGTNPPNNPPPAQAGIGLIPGLLITSAVGYGIYELYKGAGKNKKPSK